MTDFSRTDFVAPADVQKTALAIAQRYRGTGDSTFVPTASGAFDHGTTSVSTTIPAALSTTTISTQAQDRINQNTQLINRVVYILEANGMTS